MNFAEFWFTYVWVGQKLTNKGQEQQLENQQNLKWYLKTKYKKIIGIALPCIIVWTGYFIIMSFGAKIFNTENNYDVWTENFCPGAPPNSCLDGHQRWLMGIVMIFGSLVAGATSEGAGAIAFPVMTLVFSLAPIIARDFSMMSQSVGMSAAVFTLIFMRVKLVQMHVIILASISGILGIALGMEVISSLVPPAYIKMWFGVIWASFAVALYLMNRNRDRIVYDQIPDWNDHIFFRVRSYVFNWRSVIIIIGGFIGGILTGLTGNGMDICLFAILTLLFRVSEKTATPTSVVLMAINTVTGFAYRLIFQGGVEPEAWRFLAISTPIVVLGAPFGSYLSSNLSRLVLAGFVYILDMMQFFGTIIIIKPWTLNVWVSVSSIIWLLVAMLSFYLMNYKGLQIMERIEERKKKNIAKQEEDGRKNEAYCQNWLEKVESVGVSETETNF